MGKQTVNIRNCSDCNMCCKLPEINYFEKKKKSHKWCENCEIGVGCKIYEKRPKGCRDFTCAYIENFTDLKPNKVGFIIFPQNEMSYVHKVLTVYCEEFKLQNFIKNIKKDWKMQKMVENKWAFHIRYNQDDDKLAIYDPNAFDDELIFISRKEVQNGKRQNGVD
tara:strand:- start:938 stop:1432 length:495 start_codon:yes stop_codon:yes gene_type:complete